MRLDSTNVARTCLILPLALSALQLEDQLLSGLGLLPQDRFGLTSKALLLAIIPPSSLGLLGLSRLLVLGHLELLVGLALGVRAVGVPPLGQVDHLEQELRAILQYKQRAN